MVAAAAAAAVVSAHRSVVLDNKAESGHRSEGTLVRDNMLVVVAAAAEVEAEEGKLDKMASIVV